jgi:hypothetical protein
VKSARPAKPSGEQIVEKMLLSLMMEYREVLEEALDKEIVKEFADPDLRVLAGKIEDIYKSGKDVSPSALMDLLDAANLREMVSVISINEDILKDCSPLDMYGDCEKKLRDYSLLRSERKLKLLLKDALGRGDLEEIGSLTKERQKIIHARKKGLI